MAVDSPIIRWTSFVAWRGGGGGVGSVQSDVVQIYVKKIIEQYSDSAGLISPGRY